MHTDRRTDQRTALSFLALSAVLLALGFATDAWWPLAGGMWSAAAAAWWWTADPQR